MLDIEAAYTDTATQIHREWELKYVRDMTLDQIRKAETVSDLGDILLKLDRAFCKPFILRARKPSDDDDMVEDDVVSKSSSHTFIDKNVIRYQLHFIRYWPTKEMREIWAQFVQFECVSAAQDNINALWISTNMLEQINAIFIANQVDKVKKFAALPEFKIIPEPLNSKQSEQPLRSNLNVKTLKQGTRNRTVIVPPAYQYDGDSSDEDVVYAGKKKEEVKSTTLSRLERLQLREAAKVKLESELDKSESESESN